MARASSRKGEFRAAETTHVASAEVKLRIPKALTMDSLSEANPRLVFGKYSYSPRDEDAGEQVMNILVGTLGYIYCVRYFGKSSEDFYICSCFTSRSNCDWHGQVARWQTRGTDFGKVFRKALSFIGGAGSADMNGSCDTYELEGGRWRRWDP